MFGQIRNRNALVRFLPVTPNMANTLYGTGRNLILISITITGIILPRADRPGTPAAPVEREPTAT